MVHLIILTKNNHKNNREKHQPPQKIMNNLNGQVTEEI